jgi:hypothetical protein
VSRLIQTNEACPTELPHGKAPYEHPRRSNHRRAYRQGRGSIVNISSTYATRGWYDAIARRESFAARLDDGPPRNDRGDGIEVIQ